VDRYGADSLRFALINRCAGDQDVRFSEKMVEDTRNFANKIWNAARFVRLNLDGKPAASPPPRAELALMDRWILSRFARTAAVVTASLERFEFREACQHLYEFIWSEFCDWYVEMAKQDLREAPASRQAPTRAVLTWTLAETMKLLHPIMPALTEEIWQALPHDGATIMRAPWPGDAERWIDPEAEDQAQQVMEIIRVIRAMRADAGIPPGELLTVRLFTSAPLRSLLAGARRYIVPMARVKKLEVLGAEAPGPLGGISALSGETEVWLDLESGEAAQAMRARLDKQLAAVTRDLASLDDRLGSAAFVGNAPAEVVEADRARRRELAARRETIARYLARLGESSRS